MYQIDPADMPPVPICLVTLKERQDDVVDRLNNFVCNEFSLLGSYRQKVCHFVPCSAIVCDVPALAS